MSRIRFNHVFIVLILLSGMAAFFLPERFGNLLRGRAERVFAPVCSPVRRIAGSISGRLRSRADVVSAGYDATPHPEDAREEIDRLRSSVANLTVQLADLRQLYANRDLAGAVRNYSTAPLRVIGGDQGAKETLLLAATSGDGVAVGMPVVHRYGVVGRIATVAGGGAHVRLITDRGFRMTGAFGQFAKNSDGSGMDFVLANTPPPLVEGRGSGLMSITNLTRKQITDAGVKQGHWVVLQDADNWCMPANGCLLGVVQRIEPLAQAPLFADVTVAPRANLLQLREVMVVTGKMSAARTESKVKSKR